jgi:hypothetical protein
MLRLLIPMVLALPLFGGLTAPAVADKCPPLPVKTGEFCDCIVWNYGTKADAGVTINLFYPGGPVEGYTCVGTTSVGARGPYNCGQQALTDGYCGCSVTGEASYTYTSLAVEVSFSDYTPLAAVPCK